MSYLIFPTCECCHHEIRDGYVYEMDDDTFPTVLCERCGKRELKKLNPVVADMFENYLYDHRTDVRNLIIYGED